MSPEARAIISKLGQLSAEDRAAVRAALGQLKGAVPTVEPHHDWLLGGLLEELRRRGISYPPVKVEMINKLAPGYREAAAHVCEQLSQQVFGRPAQQAEGAELATATARVYADYLRETGPNRPLSLKVMLLNIGQYFEALEAGFPGYMEGGMLGRIIGRDRDGQRLQGRGDRGASAAKSGKRKGA